MILRRIFHAVGYEPHIGQVAFHECDIRFKVLIAGARFGKSLAAARDILPELMAADTRGWLVGPTYALARPEFNYLRDDLAGRLQIPLLKDNEGSAAGGAIVRTVWGAEALCLSSHNPRSLLGAELDWLLLCEAAHIEREAFERFLRARLATREGRLIVATTPRGHNWIHELYRRGLTPGNPLWRSFRNATWDNPKVPKSEIESAREELPADVFDEQYGGAFTSRAGRVYSEFELSVHVEDQPALPSGAIVFKGIDFGFTNPFVCLWVVLDANDRMIVMDEYVRARATVQEHAQEILRRDDALRRSGFNIGPAFADPSGRVEREELSGAGIRTLPARNELLGGIDIVRSRLRARQDGSRGLTIARCCANLVREFESYCWDESVGSGERVPRKIDDHALDALRYLCIACKRRVDWKSRGMNW